MKTTWFRGICRGGLATVVMVAAIGGAPCEGKAAEEIGHREAEQIAVEAYHHPYPLVIMDVSRST